MLFTAVISIHLRALSQKALRSDPHICNVYLPSIIGSRIHYKASLTETKSNRCICQKSTTKHPAGVRADPTGNIQCQLKSFRHIHLFYGFRIDAFHRAAQSYTEQGIYNHIIFICLRILSVFTGKCCRVCHWLFHCSVAFSGSPTSRTDTV